MIELAHLKTERLPAPRGIVNAHNHTGMSGIGSWLMRYLVGIRVEPGPAPIFHLRPAVNLPLAALTARWQSRWGEVQVKWETGDGGRQLTVIIPPGCRGRLEIAGTGEIRELDSGKYQSLLSTTHDDNQG